MRRDPRDVRATHASSLRKTRRPRASRFTPRLEGTVPEPHPILTVEGLAKTFALHLLGGKRVAALAPASFVVAEGSFLAVIGRSGSGKSTLLKCLFRTYLPSAG